MMNLMQTNLKKIGTTDNTIDSHLTKLFRSGTLKVACELGYDECIQSSKTLFANWMNFSTK